MNLTMFLVVNFFILSLIELLSKLISYIICDHQSLDAKVDYLNLKKDDEYVIGDCWPSKSMLYFKHKSENLSNSKV